MKKLNFADWVGMGFIIIMIIVFLLIPSPAKADWGKTGHRVIGQIAQDNLTPKAQKEISDLLYGETLATVSTWADEIRSDSSYDSYKVWHYVNMPLDKKYEEVEHTQDNVVIGIQKCIAVLKDNSASKEEKIFHLRFLVHLVGDIHQPLHVGRAEDYGGNKIYVEFFKDGTNIHRVWDTDMIENFNMSYTEISEYLQSYKKQDFAQGDAICWANESQQIVKKVYEIEVGEQLSYSYIYSNFYIVKDRLYRAGIRLANLLNSIYV
jgi:hypothetical protein